MLNQLTEHGLQSNGTSQVVIEIQDAIFVGVAHNERVEGRVADSKTCKGSRHCSRGAGSAVGEQAVQYGKKHDGRIDRWTDRWVQCQTL